LKPISQLSALFASGQETIILQSTNTPIFQPLGNPPKMASSTSNSKSASASVPESTSDNPPPQVFRETLESLAVAFILALLFKSFVADAFIIPTGSMAPTLMGAHKDIQCQECGYQYQSGASEEFDNSTGLRLGVQVIETICPLCRKRQNVEPEKDNNHVTFSGDRILVSKLAYALGSPKRWQVIVFKFIETARQNYIKRCVGLPGETIKIQHGDIYIKNPKDPDGLSTIETDGFRIARKPPSVVLATLQDVADTKHISKSIAEGILLDYWQDASGQANPKWQTSIKPNSSNRASKYDWTASVKDVPKNDASMIRFSQRIADRNNTKQDPQDNFHFISDLTAYNEKTFRTPSGRDDRLSIDGARWVGDLASECELSTTKGTESIELLLVEGGVEFLCQIDLNNGNATAIAKYEGNPISVFESNNGLIDKLQATTPVRSGSTHTLRFANVDDALRLWIDGRLIAWGIDGGYSIRSVVPDYRHVPRTTPENPLDAAPVGFGIRGGSATIQRARVFRDIFYTNAAFGGIVSSRYDQPVNIRDTKDPYRTAIGNTPENYSFDGNEYQLGPDDYFPMGDNTQASSDARLWESHGQPGRLMIGRAVMVFWPHYWYYGRIPFIPNFQRFGLIR
ncbi:MAG: signal peptidase I, partial [Planctomycetota bacterium]